MAGWTTKKKTTTRNLGDERWIWLLILCEKNDYCCSIVTDSPYVNAENCKLYNTVAKLRNSGITHGKTTTSESKFWIWFGRAIKFDKVCRATRFCHDSRLRLPLTWYYSGELTKRGWGKLLCLVYVALFSSDGLSYSRDLPHPLFAFFNHFSTL